MRIRATRLPGNPIVRPGMDERMGSNLNGPSLIRVPAWVGGALGRYYLYFADHRGSYIRLAYADSVEGAWTVHPPGTLELERSHFPARREALEPADDRMRRLVDAGVQCPHIASPDVHVDDERREVRMYFHGLLADARRQRTRVAVSHNGLDFAARPELLAAPYLRVFRYAGAHYGLAMPGLLYRSDDGLGGFERGPQLFGDDFRHAALKRVDDALLVFWTRVGDTPERILCSRLDLRGDWRGWKASDPEEVLAPEEPWEGAELELAPSVRGCAPAPVRQLRDPAVFDDDRRSYLLYSVAGESGIAIAELELETS